MLAFLRAVALPFWPCCWA